MSILNSLIPSLLQQQLPNCPCFDDEMRAVVATNFEGRGINLHPKTNIPELVKTTDGIKVITDHGEELMVDKYFFLLVTSPAGNTINTIKGTPGDKFEFKAPRSGMYKFCFHDPHSTPESFFLHTCWPYTQRA